MTAYALNLRPTATAASVTHRGITWTFDTTYTVGRFVNGDWYVVDPGSGVTVNSVSPAPSGSGASYRNGSQVNPTPAQASNEIGYDGRHGTFNASLAKSFPLALAAGDSLVSTESLTSTPYTNVIGDSVTVPLCKRASVLTVLAAAPSGPCFRPPYVGTTKALYPWAGCDLSFLPSLTLPGSAPAFTVSQAAMKGLWLDHLRGWISRYMHPADNMPDYGREITDTIGTAALLLCGTASAAKKRAIAIGLIQIGIDNYHSSLLEPTQWGADGGHMTGRKLPIVFAAKALGKIGTWALTGFACSDDDQTYHGSTYSETLWTGWAGGVGEVSPNVMWRLSSALDNGENPWRHEGKALVDWKSSPFPNNGNSNDYFPFDKHEAYRRQVAVVLVGQVLAARIMGLRTAWGHQPLFDYVDRVMNENDSTVRAALAAQAVTDDWNSLDTDLGGVDYTSTAAYAPSLGAAITSFAADMYTTYRSSH